MPTLSPRRSSRARTTQPPNSSQQAHSTTSSNSSSRNERSTRSHHKNQSPPKSITPRSRSSEEPEETARNVQSEPPQTRRRKRDPDEDEEEADTDITLRGDRKPEDGDDEEDEEEEVTRCICGQQEYPGRPIPQGEPPRSNDVNLTTKPSGEDASSIVTADATPEDGGGLFIQCDICQVWQHGGCVGIMDESMSPENYYCELCRKDLHRVSIDSNGYVTPNHSSISKPFVAPHLNLSQRFALYQPREHRNRNISLERVAPLSLPGRSQIVLKVRRASADVLHCNQAKVFSLPSSL